MIIMNVLRKLFTKMIYLNRIDVSEGTDFNEASASEERIIWHYWYFLDKGFKFQPAVCNWFHDVLMMSMSLNNIAILDIYSVDYRCIIAGISKSEAMKLLKNADLSEKIGRLQEMTFLNIFKNK